MNVEMIPPLCEHLLLHGVHAAFVCGTTGEGTSMTSAERMQVVEKWMAAGGGRMRVIVHVGHLSGTSARTLASHAEAIGAHAVASCCPAFYPIQQADQLAAMVAMTAEGAPQLPFYLYHIPAFTRLQVSMVDFLKVAGPRVPNLRGIKFTHEDLEEFLRLLHFDNGRYDILSGREQMLLAALACGGRGAIGSTFNFAAPLYGQLWREFERGDLAAARRTQALGIELTLLLRRHGGLPAAKAAMSWLGLDCGPTRPPLRTLTPVEKGSLFAALDSWSQEAQLLAGGGTAASRSEEVAPGVQHDTRFESAQPETSPRLR